MPEFLKKFLSLKEHSASILALGILFILMAMVLPVPIFLLDILLSVSMLLSIIILLYVLYINRSLDFSSFPTILLIASFLRLSLNVATTKAILSQGHHGVSAAGDVIQAFGTVVIQNNIFIGFIQFAIITIINLVVITKGSGRIAEVSARFSLDAMPGKQMAIDADLSAGLINEEQAKQRRKDLEDESSFFGAMDGASKFVRGDAIAGLIITFVNLVGGIIIGITQQSMDFQTATTTYTTLTIGDGLASQIPSLIVSTSAGLLVTKAGVVGSADKAIFGQLGRFPNVMFMAAGLATFLALVPVLPTIPFLILGAGLFFIGRNILKSSQRQSEEKLEEQKQQEVRQATEQKLAKADEPPETALSIDALRLELGYGLLGLINYKEGQKLTDQIKTLRTQLAKELGFIMPSVRIRDNMQLGSNEYSIKVKEIECAKGSAQPDMLMCMNASGGSIEIPGEPTTEPAFGLPAKWIPQNMREDALFKGYTVVPPTAVIITHITEVIKENIGELLSYSEVQKLVDNINETHKKLVEDVVPKIVSLSGLQNILKTLLSEQVSIRDLPTILEAISELGASQNITLYKEHIRRRLCRQIINGLLDEEGFLNIVNFPQEWEQILKENIIQPSQPGAEAQLALPPSKMTELSKRLNKIYAKFSDNGQIPVIITSVETRPFVQAIITQFKTGVAVLSHAEVMGKLKLKNMGDF